MQKLHRIFSAAGALQILLLSIGGVILVGVFDWLTGNDISLGIFYLIPICFAAWYTGFEFGVIVCLTAAGAWLGAESLAANRHGYSFTPVWNALVRLSFFLIINYLLTRLHAIKDKLELLVRLRTSALNAEIAERKRIQAEMTDLEDKELRRLSQQLHDQVGSHLAGIAFRAKTLSEDLDSRNAPENVRATELVKLINTSIANVRKISRLLTPLEPEHQDLKSALSRLCAEMESCFGITCSLDAPPELPPLDPDAAEQLCRIAQEAVRNAIQHAQPNAIEVRLGLEPALLRLTVQNDGKNWDPTGTSLKRGLGLRIMRNRAERIGGKFLIDSRPQGGTCVQCVIPLNPLESIAQTTDDSADLPQEIKQDIPSLNGSSRLRPELPKLKIKVPGAEPVRNGFGKGVPNLRPSRPRSKGQTQTKQHKGG